MLKQMMADIKQIGDIVWVKWKDAMLNFDTVSMEEASKQKPIINELVGFFVSENKEQIILATELCGDNLELVRNPYVIPSCLILETTIFKKKRKSHAKR